MAVNFALFWFSFVFKVIGSQALGELNIIHSPSSLNFSGNVQTDESFLKEIFSAALGLSVEEYSGWSGLPLVDPFITPEAVVEVYIDGIPTLNYNNKNIKSYPLVVDEYQADTYDALQHRMKQRFHNGGNKLININLSDPNDFSAFGEIPIAKVVKQTLQHLNYSVEEDKQFLRELQTLKYIIAKVESGVVASDNIVDFYKFRFLSLHALSDLHGPNSLQTLEAKSILLNEVQRLCKAFIKAYDGSVLVSVVSTDVSHTRRTVRAAPRTQESTTIVGASGIWFREDIDIPKSTETSQTSKPSAPEKPDAYSSDYAAMFQIFLWFGIGFTFSLVAAVNAILNIDPGRDSVIYRMTSTRIKKEN